MKHILVLASLLLFTIGTSLSQELDCDVTIDVQALPSEARDNLNDFASQVRDYMNSTQWSKENLNGEKIKCSISIQFLSFSGSNHYTAKAFIGSQRPIYKYGKNTVVARILDDKWDFSYIRNQTLTHDENRFDALLSFLDFYGFVIVGMDFDTGDFNFQQSSAGTPYFQKALELINKATSQGGSATGWAPDTRGTYTRNQLIDEMLNSKFSDFRKAVHQYFYTGLDYMYKDTVKARKRILSALEKIGNLKEKVNFNSLLIRQFFETKNAEIADLFSGDDDPDIYTKLIKIDPAHEQKYTDFRDKKK